ncbi:hypothetical protein [Brachybacterium hainanense]|uniref:Pilus assembly protein CpaE n=1 Tax=Brachybacterium hainanense TaxID=1541174 RepID=A0ABV6R8K5_9MICO
MIDIDIAYRLRDAGLRWSPADGDHFAIDTEQLRDDTFMLSSMVIERARGRHGELIFAFNGTTEWALDSVEQGEAVWIPREDQLRTALGAAFRALEQLPDGHHLVRFRLGAEDEVRTVTAPRPEDAYAGALLIALTA